MTRIAGQRTEINVSAASKFRIRAGSKDIPMPMFFPTPSPTPFLARSSGRPSENIFRTRKNRFRNQQYWNFCVTLRQSPHKKNARVVNVDPRCWRKRQKFRRILPRCRRNRERARGESERDQHQATTNEGLGAIGRSEGMAAIAVASVEVP